MDLPSSSLPYLFRSYDHDAQKNIRSTHHNPGKAANLDICTIARAATTAPPYFKAKEIEEKTFVDGAFGHNNPTYLAYQEVDQKHKHEAHEAALRDPSRVNDTARHGKNIISIGTGRCKTARLVAQAGFARYRNWIRQAARMAVILKELRK
jgi:patatin-like phospholipase/acyl hydrolase